MKKVVSKLALLSVSMLLVFSCGTKGPKGFTKTEKGLYYKFEEPRNMNTPQPQIGDILVGEMTVKLNDSVLMSNEGNPQRLFKVSPNQFNGDVNEGLLLMHIGERATFAVQADTIAKYMPLPDFYIPNSNAYVYYDFYLTSIVSKSQLDKESEEMAERLQNAKNAETELIDYYIQSNNIKVKPTSSGLYITNLKKGKGAKVEQGKTLKVNYVGKFVDGKLFDTSIEKEAQDAGIFDARRTYEPMEYVHGNTGLIPGWIEAVSGMQAGDKVRVLIPSEMAYGERGSQPVIPPYTPLVFEIEVLSVQ